MLFCTSAVGIPATEALKKGLEDLHELCQHVLHTFEVWSLKDRLTFKLYDHYSASSAMVWVGELCFPPPLSGQKLERDYIWKSVLMHQGPSLTIHTSLSLFLQASVTKFKESQSQDYGMT